MTDQPKAPKSVQTALNAWHQIEIWIAVLAFGAIAILLIYDVILREAIMPALAAIGIDARSLILYGSQKIAVFLLIIGAFVGIGIATWTGAQLVPKIGHRLVPARWNNAADRIADAVTFAFLVAVTVIAAMFVYDSFQSGQLGSTGVRIEVWKIQIALPFGFASAALRYLAFCIWPSLRPEQGESLE